MIAAKVGLRKHSSERPCCFASPPVGTPEPFSDLGLSSLCTTTALAPPQALNALALEAEDEAARRREEANLRMDEAIVLRQRQESLRGRRVALVSFLKPTRSQATIAGY